ncbi:lipid A-modifier LpxR family protein [Brevundimonas sp. GN22]
MRKDWEANMRRLALGKIRTGQVPQAIAGCLCIASVSLGGTEAMAQSLASSQDWSVTLDRRSLGDLPSSQAWREDRVALSTASGDRWTVRHANPVDTPLAFSRPDTRDREVAVEWRHDWTALHETSPSGLELSVSPHAGFDWNPRGSSPVAGATVRVGRGLDRLAPDGDEAFGQKARWYVFASGSKRAVGYNFTRQRDGGFANEGLSHDLGSSAMGDAAIGVAWRKGPIQSSVGLSYREVEIDGLRGYGGLKTDVGEGVLAFQLSIRPQ